MESHGSITVYTGPMFSGKTQALMARLQSKERAHKQGAGRETGSSTTDSTRSARSSVKQQHGAEVREARVDGGVSDQERRAISARSSASSIPTSSASTKRSSSTTRSAGVARHRSRTSPAAASADVRIARNLEVYVAGLDLDAWARPFGPMPNLLAFADRVEKFTANCFQCGQDARLHAEDRRIGGTNRGRRRRSVRGAVRGLLDASGAVSAGRGRDSRTRSRGLRRHADHESRVPSSGYDAAATRLFERRRAPAARELDAERLDLVVHHARADREQLRRVLLHPVRHLQRFDQRVPLDVLERDAGRRDLDDRRLVAAAARPSALRRAAGRRRRSRGPRPAASPARSCSRARGCCPASCSASAASARRARGRRSSSSARAANLRMNVFASGTMSSLRSRSGGISIETTFSR